MMECLTFLGLRIVLGKLKTIEGFQKGKMTVYARVTKLHVQADQEDSVIELYNNSVIPAAKQQKGFKGLLNLIDRESGNIMSISLWETEADLLLSESNNYYQDQLAKFRRYMVKNPERLLYEVTAQE